MRRFYLWSASGLVALIVVAGLAAGYVRQHPDTVLARCGDLLYSTAVWCTAASKAPAQVTPLAQSRTQPIVFSELQSPEALRHTLLALQHELAPRDGLPALPTTAPIQLALYDNAPARQKAKSDDDDEGFDIPPVMCEPDGDTQTDDEVDLAKVWLQLFAGGVKENKQRIVPTPKASQGGAEEAEPSHPSRPANCQEDPSYDLQYPGCPYTGPRSGKQTPNDPLLPLQEHKGVSPSNLMMQPKPKLNEEVPAHPEVDTMEFRPSDAQDGDFDPHPL